MHIRVFSDLHLEFGRNERIHSGNFHISELPTDKETVLCLVGDVCSIESNRYHEEILNPELAERFKKVLYLPGNHEYYNGSVASTDKKLQEYCDNNNIFFLQKKSIEIDDVIFIGATLWSDISKAHPFEAFKIAEYMNDYRKIRNGPTAKPYLRKLTTADTTNLHRDHLKFIENELYVYADRKCCVMSHHAPSEMSINAYYRMNSDVNRAYYSDLDDLILKYQPAAWFHGHSHRACSYQIEKTSVVCNPVGYPNEDSGFDPVGLIEI